MQNEFYVDHTEYTPARNPMLVERTLGVYGRIGLRPDRATLPYCGSCARRA